MTAYTDIPQSLCFGDWVTPSTLKGEGYHADALRDCALDWTAPLG